VHARNYAGACARAHTHTHKTILGTSLQFVILQTEFVKWDYVTNCDYTHTIKRWKFTHRKRNSCRHTCTDADT